MKNYYYKLILNKLFVYVHVSYIRQILKNIYIYIQVIRNRNTHDIGKKKTSSFLYKKSC